MFTLSIKTGNAAFEPSALREVARILTGIADDFQDADLPTAGRVDTGALRDINGNRVGHWIYTSASD